MNIKIVPTNNSLNLSDLEPRTVFIQNSNLYVKMQASVHYGIKFAGVMGRRSCDPNLLAMDLRTGALATWGKDFAVDGIVGTLEVD